MLEAAVGDDPYEYGFQKDIAKTGRVNTDVAQSRLTVRRSSFDSGNIELGILTNECVWIFEILL